MNGRLDHRALLLGDVLPHNLIADLLLHYQENAILQLLRLALEVSAFFKGRGNTILNIKSALLHVAFLRVTEIRTITWITPWIVLNNTYTGLVIVHE